MQWRERIGLVAALAAAVGAWAQANEASPVITPPTAVGPEDGFPGCYPIGSVIRGREGRVEAQVTILPDGAVGKVELPAGTPAWMRSAALCMVERIRFTPGLLDGVPVEAEATLPITFGLKGADGQAPPDLAIPQLRTGPDEMEAAYGACYPAGLTDEVTVHYRFTIGIDGRVSGPRAIRGSGDRRLDKAGACILRKLRFTPLVRGSQAVKATVAMDIFVRPGRAP
jgi:TonB family protein